MRAYEIIPGTTVEAIRLTERSAPVACAGQVVIDIRARSINFRDVINISGSRDGSPKTTGVIPCSDGAGVVAAVGEGVTRLKVGDRVAGAFMPDWLNGPMTPEVQAGALGGTVDGVLAEQIALPATGVVKIPEHLTFEEAATLPCAGVTAWYAQFVGGHILPGDTVLLLGTGGVSIFSLQFAKMAGARVILTSSSDEKLERARALGADHVINYRRQPEWQNAVLEFTDGKGADHAVEVGGPDTFEPNQLDGLFAVCKHRREPLPFSFTDFFEPQDFSFNLNERHILGYFTQFVEPASVYISVGIMPQQILDRVDRKFFVEYFGFFWPYTREKFNVLI